MSGSVPKKILCAVDLSDFAAPVLAHGMALARHFGAEVTALHVFAAWAPPPGVSTYPGWMTQIPEAREAIATELRTLVEPFTAGGGLRLHTAEGDAAKEIVRYAGEWSADLVILGTHGRSGFDRFALGSVAEKVLRKASCPVLTLPPGSSGSQQAVEYRELLCPTDFSETSKSALDFAVALAVRSKGAVTALHVVDILDGELGMSGPPYIVELRRRQCEVERESLRQLLTVYAASGCPVSELTVLGRPHKEILRLAAERRIDLIVMGVRGRGPVDLALFGSTTNQVVRRSTCPVVTVRA